MSVFAQLAFARDVYRIQKGSSILAQNPWGFSLDLPDFEVLDLADLFDALKMAFFMAFYSLQMLPSSNSIATWKDVPHSISRLYTQCAKAKIAICHNEKSVGDRGDVRATTLANFGVLCGDWILNPNVPRLCLVVKDFKRLPIPKDKKKDIISSESK